MASLSMRSHHLIVTVPLTFLAIACSAKSESADIDHTEAADIAPAAGAKAGTSMPGSAAAGDTSMSLSAGEVSDPRPRASVPLAKAPKPKEPVTRGNYEALPPGSPMPAAPAPMSDLTVGAAREVSDPRRLGLSPSGPSKPTGGKKDSTAVADTVTPRK